MANGARPGSHLRELCVGRPRPPGDPRREVPGGLPRPLPEPDLNSPDRRGLGLLALALVQQRLQQRVVHLALEVGAARGDTDRSLRRKLRLFEALQPRLDEGSAVSTPHPALLHAWDPYGWQ